jgi:predicted TIM-barrel fold metal-dependent hydrolase
LLAGGACARAPDPPVDPRLAAEIAAIQAIDNHAHPVRPTAAGEEPDHDYDALPVEMLEEASYPVRFRPQTPNAPRPSLTPAAALDRAGIERMVANRVAMGGGLPPERFLWAAYADALMYPFPTRVLAHNSDRAAFFALEEKLLQRYYREAGVAARPATLEAYLAQVVRRTLERHQQGGAIAEKFEMAYLRSLAIGNPGREEAERIWRLGPAAAEAGYLALQDYIFRYIARECGRLGMAIHFHTGAGAGGYYGISGSNPLQLEPLFNDPELRQTRFVLVHGGWPFTREAAALLSKPNVYLDFSGQNLILPASDLAQSLRAWLEFVPEKVLFGTDAYPYAPSAGLGWEETAFTAAQTGRAALGLALTAMLREGSVTAARASELARMVLRDNAGALYKLK